MYGLGMSGSQIYQELLSFRRSGGNEKKVRKYTLGNQSPNVDLLAEKLQSLQTLSSCQLLRVNYFRMF